MNGLRFLAPNVVTAAALTCGAYSIVLAMSGRPLEASWWILYATILDKMDGAVARALRSQSPFGAQLDCFADFVSFGLAPAFLFLGTLPGEVAPAMMLPALVYVLGAAARLSRFTLRDEGSVFEGVPSTMAGGVYAVSMIVALDHGLPERHLVWSSALVLTVFGVAMNTPWLRYTKVGTGPTRFVQVALLAVVATCMVLIVTRWVPEVLLGLTGTSMLIGPLVARLESPGEPVGSAGPAGGAG